MSAARERHVLVDAREQFFVRDLERERQILAVDFLEDALDRAIVEIDDVFEDEEQVLDFLRELGIAFGQAVENVLLGFAIDEAHHVRQRLNAAGLREVRAAHEQPASEQFVELFQNFRCGLLQNRDAHRDFGLQVRRQRGKHRAGLFGGHVHENQRDRLRMFVLNELQQLRRFGLLDEFERIAVLERREEPVRHVVGLAGAEAERSRISLAYSMPPSLMYLSAIARWYAS